MVDIFLLLYYVVDYGLVGTFVRSRHQPEPLWSVLAQSTHFLLTQSSRQMGTKPRRNQSYVLWRYRVSFPYLLHPYKSIFLSASIFMVVAISAERHRAICSPLTHRPAFWPYAMMVLCISGEWRHATFTTATMDVLSSGTWSIPKFFEFELHSEDGYTDYKTTRLNELQARRPLSLVI